MADSYADRPKSEKMHVCYDGDQKCAQGAGWETVAPVKVLGAAGILVPRAKLSGVENHALWTGTRPKAYAEWFRAPGFSSRPHLPKQVIHKA